MRITREAKVYEQLLQLQAKGSVTLQFGTHGVKKQVNGAAICSIHSLCWGEVIDALNSCISSVSMGAGRPSENLTQCLRDCGVVPARKSVKATNYLWYDPLNGLWEFSFTAWLSRRHRLQEQHSTMANKKLNAKLSLAASSLVTVPAPLTFSASLDSSTTSSLFMHKPFAVSASAASAASAALAASAASAASFVPSFALITASAPTLAAATTPLAPSASSSFAVYSTAPTNVSPTNVSPPNVSPTDVSPTNASPTDDSIVPAYSTLDTALNDFIAEIHRRKSALKSALKSSLKSAPQSLESRDTPQTVAQ
eukprot:1030471-Rhodomonas_salina.1